MRRELRYPHRARRGHAPKLEPGALLPSPVRFLADATGRPAGRFRWIQVCHRSPGRRTSHTLHPNHTHPNHTLAPKPSPSLTIRPPGTARSRRTVPITLRLESNVLYWFCHTLQVILSTYSTTTRLRCWLQKAGIRPVNPPRGHRHLPPVTCHLPPATLLPLSTTHHPPLTTCRLPPGTPAVQVLSPASAPCWGARQTSSSWTYSKYTRMEGSILTSWTSEGVRVDE